MKRIFKMPYVLWLVGIFLVYIILTSILSQFYVTIQYIPYYLHTINWTELALSILFTLTIAALIAVNSVYSYIKFQERASVKKATTLTCAAAIGGFSTGVCAACVTGAFPLVLGFFGVAFSWGMLPFKGMEIQVLIIAVLGTSLYLLQKK
ncbi:hypothetical protein HZB03_03915 [Candidatus Woesearchaeota archaeon]|nr:hypothetical protein [Candidatus Woesearchaeota archaeon]